MNNKPTGAFNGTKSMNTSNNGGGNPSSLSAVTAVSRADNKNEQMANLQNQKASTPQGKRASDYNSGKGLGTPKSQTSGNSNKSQQGSSKENRKQNLDNVKKMVAKEALKKFAAANGIPEPVTEAALNSKRGQKLLDRALKKKDPLSMMKDGAKKVGDGFDKFADKFDDKPEHEKTLDQKSDEKEQKKIGSGEIDFEFSLKTIKWLVILTPVLSVVVFFLLIVVASLSDEKVSSMVIAGMVSDSEGKKLISEVQTGQGAGNNQAVGRGNYDYPQEYYDRISSLGNVYSSQKDCEGEECLSRSEFLYYLKVADLALRYKNKYHVDLDWYLISSTNLYFDRSTEDTMKANLGGYNKDSVEDYNTMSGLDWDNDYKNMSGYQYLDADDSSYDLQILAKNMVKKKTIQTCTNSNGNVTAKQEDEDVEDKYFAVGAEKRLNCGSGQTYNINSTYTKDLDKYDEFLLEYIDKKMYSYGSGKKGNSDCIITNNSYVWPIGSMDITTIEGREHALGEPATVVITSYFGSTESFRISGHGAIDISGVSQVGKVPVIAAKQGTVVYPTDKSQTQFADNGHYGSKDGGGYGNYVIIQHDNDTYTLYGHLAQNSITVTAGDTVSQGQVIGKLGHSGSSTGPHLHFEMRAGGNSSANRVDPLKYVDPKNPRPGTYASSSCTAGNNMSEAFVNLALEQLNDPSASGGEKYRKFMCSGCGYYAWCAAFVSWVINNTEHNGQKMSDIIKYKSTWVYEFVNYFYSSTDPNIKFKYNDHCSKFTGKNGSGNYIPKQGDIIFFDWDTSWNGSLPTQDASHIGIVQKVENGNVITIEGNSSDSVRERSYPLNSCQVMGYGSWY